MMSYQASLSRNQKLVVNQLGIQTAIALTASTQGQQQSQATSFTTGTWQRPPRLYQQGLGFILEIHGDLGIFYVALSNTGINSIAKPDLNSATPMTLQNTPPTKTQDFDFATMSPMEPMQPMSMGNMSMNLNSVSNSMSMSMGNMSMKMGNMSDSSRPQTFCNQCGQKAKIGDRFCRSCGNNLTH